MDVVSKAVRSQIMSRVKGFDTQPELVLRQVLHRNGFRYRLHVRSLPGSPDMVLPKTKLVIFVNGCFWHWHGCRRSRLPLDNRPYWREKIGRNVSRDHSNYNALQELGWRVLLVWECALKKAILEETIEQVQSFISGDKSFASIEPIV